MLVMLEQQHDSELQWGHVHMLSLNSKVTATAEDHVFLTFQIKTREEKVNKKYSKRI